MKRNTTLLRDEIVLPQPKRHRRTMSSKPPPPEEDAREWLLFDIEDQDPVAANFLKPLPNSPAPVHLDACTSKLTTAILGWTNVSHIS